MTDESELGKPGRSFDDYLIEQGTHNNATEQAVTRGIAHQLTEAMHPQNLSKAEHARRLETGHSQIDRPPGIPAMMA